MKDTLPTQSLFNSKKTGIILTKDGGYIDLNPSKELKEEDRFLDHDYQLDDFESDFETEN